MEGDFVVCKTDYLNLKAVYKAVKQHMLTYCSHTFDSCSCPGNEHRLSLRGVQAWLCLLPRWLSDTDDCKDVYDLPAVHLKQYNRREQSDANCSCT